MITEVVWSPVKDDSRKDLQNSPIWKNCYREDEMVPSIKIKSSVWYVYQIKFEGLTPVQCTKFKEVKSK
jgi:hypothetical protein